MAFWNFQKSEKDKYIDEAKKAKRRGELDRAGDYFFMADEVEEALEMYVRGGHHQLAAQMLQKKGDLRRAAEQFLLARDLRAAATLYQKLGEGKKASGLYEKLGEHFKAAQMEELARAWRRAAELYVKAGQLEKAAENYAKEGDHLRAAETLEDHLLKLPTTGGDKAQIERQWASCADLFLRARRPARAAEIWGRLGLEQKAAEAFEKAGEFSRAVEMFLKAKDVDRAARALSQAPDGSVDRAVRAELAHARGQWREAAELYRELGENGKSAECFEKSGDKLLAAEQYELSGDVEVAADLRYAAGEFARASRLYEQALRFLMAARAAEEAGETERAAKLFVSAHEPVDAARCLRVLGQLDQAIAILQHVPPTHDSYTEASTLLGDLFREKDLPGIAEEKYRGAIGTRGVDESTIDAYYGLALLAEQRGEGERAIELLERIVATSFSYRDAAKRLDTLRRAQRSAATPLATGATSGFAAPVMPVAGAHGRPGLPGGGSGPAPTETQALPVDPVQLDAGAAPVAAAPPSAALLAGRYEMVARVGSSTRGDVYKAWDNALGRTVVLKRLVPQDETEEGQHQRYINEARQASKLHHSNVATIYDAVDVAEGRFIATEYVFGENLRDLLGREGRLSPARAVEVASQVLLALEYAHGTGVTHRNLRPENILIAEKSHIKVTDFGMNRRYGDLLKEPYGPASPLHYISPEQIRGEKVDARADIYALGCVLYEMLTGKPPFTGPELVEGHLNRTPAAPSSIESQVPAAIDKAVLRCLEKDPGRRFSAAHQVYEELRAYDFIPGQRIGDRYELLRELGTGGMGKVYLARDLELDEVIAMKVLRPEFGTDTMVEQRFLREIKLARKIVHPSVVKVYDFGKWKNVKYITMEYIDGVSLEEWVKRNQPPRLDDISRFLVQICEALDEAHRLGVVHRDIKPQNVLISADRRAKIVDFGIARLDDYEDLTSSRLIVGSPKYMSPEQISGRNIDHRTDIYSLGVVAYYCVTGIEPFTAEDTNGIILKQLHETPTPPSQINLALPQWLELVILKCLVKDPRGRYQRAGEVAQDLLAHLR